MVQTLWRTVWRFPKKLKTELPYDRVILLLGIYSEINMVLKRIHALQCSLKHCLKHLRCETGPAGGAKMAEE